MRRFNLCARIRRPMQPVNGYRKARSSSLANNALNRRFYADHPGQKLLTDVTYVRYYEQNQWRWGYLSVVLDLYDRSVVSWVYSKRQDLRLAMRILKLLSFEKLHPDALLHSDQGYIYTAGAFREIQQAQAILN